jgi:hypothetical protein
MTESLEARWALSGGMYDVENLDASTAQTVWEDVRQSSNYQFTRPINTTLASRGRIGRKNRRRSFNTLLDGDCGRWLIFGDITNDLRQGALSAL